MGLDKGAVVSGSLVSMWLLLVQVGLTSVSGIGVNWGTQLTHPLPPPTMVAMLRDNGFQKVKLFDADSSIMSALGNSGIQVMVGIPNEMLADLASNVQAAENWVTQNISSHVSTHGVDVRYVAVGNEPLLPTYNGSFLTVILPALQNIQAAITKAGLSPQVKVTVPLNANVYGTSTGLPSGGDFQSDVRDLMLLINKFLSDNGSPFVVNIYPYISLHEDPYFPVNYAFFDGNSSTVNDGGTIYANVFDANYDTLVWALQKNGYGNLSIIVGEVGWPTDGDKNANLTYARKFNQGFMNHMKTGTPLRPGELDAYLFSLVDEDGKSIEPGNFERHWGLFYYDGKPKYSLNLGTGSNGLVAAKDVQYQAKQWCIMDPAASLEDPNIGPSVSYACTFADCTSLGYETSCGNLDARGNVSYAFNSYYQENNQLETACRFPNVSVVTTKDPSTNECKFNIMILSHISGAEKSASLTLLLVLLLLINLLVVF